MTQPLIPRKAVVVERPPWPSLLLTVDFTKDLPDGVTLSTPTIVQKRWTGSTWETLASGGILESGPTVSTPYVQIVTQGGSNDEVYLFLFRAARSDGADVEMAIYIKVVEDGAA